MHSFTLTYRSLFLVTVNVFVLRPSFAFSSDLDRFTTINKTVVFTTYYSSGLSTDTQNLWVSPSPFKITCLVML